MLKGGMLSAPVIQPLRCSQVGTRLKVCPNTYIQIKTGKLNIKKYLKRVFFKSKFIF